MPNFAPRSGRCANGRMEIIMNTMPTRRQVLAASAAASAAGLLSAPPAIAANKASEDDAIASVLLPRSGSKTR